MFFRLPEKGKHNRLNVKICQNTLNSLFLCQKNVSGSLKNILSRGCFFT